MCSILHHTVIIFHHQFAEKDNAAKNSEVSLVSVAGENAAKEGSSSSAEILKSEIKSSKAPVVEDNSMIEDA